MKKCPNCQENVSEDDLFCEHCGQSLADKSEAEEEKVFCQMCGSANAADHKFCEACGASLEEDTAASAEEEDQTLPLVPPPTAVKPSQTSEEAPELIVREKVKKAPMARWKKVVIGLVLLFVVLLFGTYKYLEHHFNPLNKIVEMDEALEAGDEKAFLSHINFDKGVPFDATSYFDFIKDSAWSNGVKEELYYLIETDMEEAKPFQLELTNSHGDLMYKIKKEKILMGLFNTYTLSAVPLEAEITANMDEAEIELQDLKYEFSKSNDDAASVQVYPGIYAIKASSQSEYGDFSFEDQLAVSYADPSIDVAFEYQNFDVYTDYDYQDAILFINDKSTKKTLADIHAIGPVPMDADLTAFAEWEDEKKNKIKSKTVKLDKAAEGNAYLEFDERIKLDEDDDDEDYDVAEFILDFREAYEDAVNYSDFDDVSSYLKSGSDEEKDLKKFIKDMGKADYYYEFKETNVTDVKKEKDNKYTANTTEHFIFHDKDGSVYDYDRDKVYFLEEIDGEFKVYKIDYKDTRKKRIS